MALLDTFKKKKETPKTKSEKQVKKPKMETGVSVALKKKTLSEHDAESGAIRVTESPLMHPRITEKSTEMSEKGAYIFDVRINATKTEIRKSVSALFGVSPKKIRIIRIAPRTYSSMRRKMANGTGPARKKAIVFLKKGDKIEFA
ncbi:50S ribosomal protein L23 [bacterium]|nr:50S ribosomal protein L23 [bacterium]MCI0566190.1 50S ribosomal protein L23 [bacterium]MCI0680047.1 50S ribosomal protein L23 [bacterium]